MAQPNCAAAGEVCYRRLPCYRYEVYEMTDESRLCMTVVGTRSSSKLDTGDCGLYMPHALAHTKLSFCQRIKCKCWSSAAQ